MSPISWNTAPELEALERIRRSKAQEQRLSARFPLEHQVLQYAIEEARQKAAEQAWKQPYERAQFLPQKLGPAAAQTREMVGLAGEIGGYPQAPSLAEAITRANVPGAAAGAAARSSVEGEAGAYGMAPRGLLDLLHGQKLEEIRAGRQGDSGSTMQRILSGLSSGAESASALAATVLENVDDVLDSGDVGAVAKKMREVASASANTARQGDIARYSAPPGADTRGIDQAYSRVLQDFEAALSRLRQKREMLSRKQQTPYVEYDPTAVKP